MSQCSRTGKATGTAPWPAKPGWIVKIPRQNFDLLMVEADTHEEAVAEAQAREGGALPPGTEVFPRPARGATVEAERKRYEAGP